MKNETKVIANEMVNNCLNAILKVEALAIIVVVGVKVINKIK